MFQKIIYNFIACQLNVGPGLTGRRVNSTFGLVVLDRWYITIDVGGSSNPVLSPILKNIISLLENALKNAKGKYNNN